MLCMIGGLSIEICIFVSCGSECDGWSAFLYWIEIFVYRRMESIDGNGLHDRALLFLYGERLVIRFLTPFLFFEEELARQFVCHEAFHACCHELYGDSFPAWLLDRAHHLIIQPSCQELLLYL